MNAVVMRSILRIHPFVIFVIFCVSVSVDRRERKSKPGASILLPIQAGKPHESFGT
jgi:hypothetical protein